MSLTEGRTLKKAVFPRRYIQGTGAINELPRLVSLLGHRGLVLASRSGIEKVLPRCNLDLESNNISTELFRGESCESEIARVKSIVDQRQADVIVGMGGGKVIDTAKIVADRMDIPVIVVPTIASNDAPTSGCAVLYSEDGVFEAVCY